VDLLRAALTRYRDGGVTAVASRASERLAETVESRLLVPLYSRLFDLRHGSGVDVMAEDWDTLVLLDACRFDDFERENTLDGELERRLSQGVDSPSFIAANFAGRTLHDCVYVSANPHVREIDPDTFHAVVAEPLATYSPADGCVRPEAVTDAAVRAHERFPNKRLVVHYMQPHDPPIGPTARDLESEIDLGGWAWSGVDAAGERLLPAVEAGVVDPDVAREAYRENLRIVLDEVESLLAELDGKTVVSADHGEMFGERPYRLLGPLYEHWQNPRTVELCTVPWLVVDGDERRRIVSDPPIGIDVDVDELGDGVDRSDAGVDVEAQLSALGYRDRD
jgi:hypothetical protein